MDRQNNHLLVMQLNINGCSQNAITALNNYINREKAKVVLLSETKSSTISDSDFDNYKVLLKPNKLNPKQKGGVAILIHESLTAERLHHLEKDETDAIFTALQPSYLSVRRLCSANQLNDVESDGAADSYCHQQYVSPKMLTVCCIRRF